MFGLAGSESSKKKVYDMLKDICAEIPKTVLVYSPPIEKVVRSGNLRSSFVIIVSDIFNTVSTFIIKVDTTQFFFSFQTLLLQSFKNVDASDYYDNFSKFIFVEHE